MDYTMDNNSDQASEREDDSGIESSAPDPNDSAIYIRITIADLKTQKCLQFHPEDTVWTAKERILATMARDLKDGMNYGLYCPPINGRAGKFLDEERPLRDYPLPGPIGHLEFKYKRRVYKLMQINPRKLRQMHTKANLKQFMDAVKKSDIEKVTKFTNKGVDPNFHEHESGETPLSIASSLENPRNLIIALVSGGAHVDFRTKDGLTSMHKAAIKGNLQAMKTLLDLGASPNYKDSRGLSPLYHCVCHDTNAHCVEVLLHDYSVVGLSDERGWCEVHQACKHGRVQHLEHLLFYGADMNQQNSSGNTPLHISAVNNQDSCARVLLFRGADKSIQNYANQDAFQVAVIAGNCELAEVIKNFKPQDVVPFQEVPKYNDKRRTGLGCGFATLSRSRSDPRLNLSLSLEGGNPPSPCLSNNSFPHYTSNGHLFDSPNSGMPYRKNYDSDSPRSMSISSAGSVSGLSERRCSLSLDRSTSGTGLFGRRSSATSERSYSTTTTCVDRSPNASLFGRRTSASERSQNPGLFGRRSSITSEKAFSSRSSVERGFSVVASSSAGLFGRPPPDRSMSMDRATSGGRLFGNMISLSSDRKPVMERASSSLGFFSRRSSVTSERTFSVTPSQRRTSVTSERTFSVNPSQRRSSVQSDRPFTYLGLEPQYERRLSVTSDSPVYSYSKKRLYAATPGRNFICIKNYKPTDEAEIKLKKGDFVEVISVGQGGYWEGKVGEREGWFPSNHIQEVTLRNKANLRHRGSRGGVEDDAVLIRRQTLAALAASDGDNTPRTVVLQKGKNGFGFVLRGAKAQSQSGASLEFTPTTDFPALQYLDRVDKGSPADRAGLKPGDFLLEINHEVVVNATHEHTVRLIKNSGDTLAMKVITVKPLGHEGMEHEVHIDGTRTLPLKKNKAPVPPRRDPHTSLTMTKVQAKSVRDSLAELEKLDLTLMQYEEQDEEQLNAMAAKRGVDPSNKTASIRSRQAQARMTAVEIQDIMARTTSVEDANKGSEYISKPVVQTYASVSELKAKKNGSATLPKNLNRARSTPNLAQNDLSVHPGTSQENYTRHITRVDINDEVPPPSGQYGRSMSSSSTSSQSHYSNPQTHTREHLYATPTKGPRRYGSVEHLLEGQQGSVRIPPHPREAPPMPPQRGATVIPPPPDHPPPIPPHHRAEGSDVGEVVKITKSPTYANVSAQIAADKAAKQSDSPYESSFRPGMGARLNKEVNLPENLGPPKLTHSRTNSSISSGSDYSDSRTNVRGMAERFESADNTPQRKGSVSFAEDKVFENAAKFINDHPNATLLVTADIHDGKKTDKQQQYYEPEPDYDTIPGERSGVDTTAPSVSSVRDTWAARDAQSHSPASRTPSTGSQPTTPKTPRDDEKNLSQFSSAIQQAALRRETRRGSSPQPAVPAQDTRHVMQRQSSSGSVNRPRQAPPPPPPPPPAEPLPHRQSPLVIRKTPAPAPLQKQRQEEKKVDESHAALMAAIAKRRNLVENTDRQKLASELDDKISRTKKLQSTPVHKLKPKEAPPKVEKKPPEAAPSPFGQSMLRPTGSPKIPAKNEAPKKEEPKKEEPKKEEKPVTPVTPSGGVEGESLTDRAERLRQQYLQKKAAGTLDRRKGSPSSSNPASPVTPRTTAPSTPTSASPVPPPPQTIENNEEEKENKPKTTDYCSPRQPVQNSMNNNSNGGSAPGIADLASVIAQRAMARQKSYEAIVDTNGNQPNKTSYSTVYKGSGTMANGTANGGTKRGVAPPLGGDSQVQIPVRGATTDATNTESAPSTPAHPPPSPSRQSVSDRTRIFESASREGSMSPKVPAKPVRVHQDLPFELPPPTMFDTSQDNPPPMVAPPPPPDFDYNARPTDLDIINGHNSRGRETVGWVINSSPSRSSHEVAVRSKLAYRNGGPVDVHYNGSGGVAQVAMISPPHIDYMVEEDISLDFIPPPPVFDSENTDILSSLPTGFDIGSKLVQEDNASMVSSLSTLSTLSSTEQDTYHHDSSGYSSSRNRGYGSSLPSTSSQHSDEGSSDVAPPPPPGFDDLGGGENHYEELDVVQAFIPPPMGFGTSPPHHDPPVTSLRQAMRPRRDFEDKPMEEWSVEDVAEWLDFMQLSEHSAIFLRNNVDGRMLCKMGRNELIAMGVTQVGHRMSLERAIKRAQLNR